MESSPCTIISPSEEPNTSMCCIIRSDDDANCSHGGLDAKSAQTELSCRTLITCLTTEGQLYCMRLQRVVRKVTGGTRRDIIGQYTYRTLRVL